MMLNGTCLKLTVLEYRLAVTISVRSIISSQSDAIRYDDHHSHSLPAIHITVKP